jgi:hypothetical protein
LALGLTLDLLLGSLLRCSRGAASSSICLGTLAGWMLRLFARWLAKAHNRRGNRRLLR